MDLDALYIPATNRGARGAVLREAPPSEPPLQVHIVCPGAELYDDVDILGGARRSGTGIGAEQLEGDATQEDNLLT